MSSVTVLLITFDVVGKVYYGLNSVPFLQKLVTERQWVSLKHGSEVSVFNLSLLLLLPVVIALLHFLLLFL